jgi:hypothetical protein
MPLRIARKHKRKLPAGRQAFRVRLNLEPLEDRTLPATITWIAGSGNFDDGANWSGGVVPGPNDVAVIDTGSTAATITIQNGDNIQVQAINTASADTLALTGVLVGIVPGGEYTGGALTVTSGSSTLNGSLSISGGGSLTASGSAVSLTANGTAAITNGSLSAKSGAQLSLPTLTAIDTGGVTDSTVSLGADGIGSVLNVSALTTYRGGSTGSHRGFTYPVNGDLSATNGGTVLAGALTNPNGVDLTLDGTGALAISQWTAYDGGLATISGGTYTFPNLTNADGTRFMVNGGAQVSLPAITSIPSGSYLEVLVSGGAQVSLPAATSIAGGWLIAEGTGSTINAPVLTTFIGPIPNEFFGSVNSVLEATGGGTILANAVTTLNAMDLELDGTGTVTLGITIAGTSSGSYGQLQGTGSDLQGPINLNGARLQLSHTAATPVGSTFTILTANFGVVGTFQGLPEGAVVTASDGTQFSISYQANGGNDVTLTQLTTLGPTLTSFSPTSGPAGTVVSITGTKFTGATAVAFGGVAATAFTVNSDTQITATVPTGAMTGPISVTTPNGTALNTASFSTPPTITGFSPGSGPLGSQVAIIGTNFLAVSAVAFNGAAASSFTVNSPTQITATVPNAATNGPITVTTLDGSASSMASFTVSAPTITSFSPVGRRVGIVVTITGYGFSGATQVSFNGIAASTFTVISATQLMATVPSGAMTGPISVTTPFGTGTSSSIFTVDQTSSIIATGPDAGGGPQVNVYDSTTNNLINSFFAYDAGFTGGVRVAVGDVNGDGIPDIITGAGPGGGSDIRVFDGKTGALLREFSPFNPLFTGSQYLAAADLNHQGYDDIIVGADYGGGPNVVVFDGKTGAILYNFFAYNPAFIGGVRVATDDVLGNGQMDIICGAGPGGGPNVTVFQPNADGTVTPIRSFFAYNPAFNLGIYVAAGDVQLNGKDQIITGAGAGGGPNVSVFDGGTGALLSSFFAYDPGFVGGVRVATAHRGDGGIVIVTAAGPGGGAQVTEFDSAFGGTAVDTFFAYNPLFNAGLWVGGA